MGQKKQGKYNSQNKIVDKNLVKAKENVSEILRNQVREGVVDEKEENININRNKKCFNNYINKDKDLDADNTFPNEKPHLKKEEKKMELEKQNNIHPFTGIKRLINEQEDLSKNSIYYIVIHFQTQILLER